MRNGKWWYDIFCCRIEDQCGSRTWARGDCSIESKLSENWVSSRAAVAICSREWFWNSANMSTMFGSSSWNERAIVIRSWKLSSASVRTHHKNIRKCSDDKFKNFGNLFRIVECSRVFGILVVHQIPFNVTDESAVTMTSLCFQMIHQLIGIVVGDQNFIDKLLQFGRHIRSKHAHIAAIVVIVEIMLAMVVASMRICARRMRWIVEIGDILSLPHWVDRRIRRCVAVRGDVQRNGRLYRWQKMLFE